MTQDIPPNASLPEPDLDQCRGFEASAKGMLHRAWDNPHELGEDSSICKEATTLLATIRSHCSPQPDDDGQSESRTAFLNALKLAWLAVWRARDYSASALKRRAQANSWEYNPRDYYHANDVRSFGQVEWFAHHYPVYDRDGEPVDRSRINFQHNHHFQRIPQYYEGVMVSAADQVPNNHLIHLRWALIQSPLQQRQQGMVLENCFVEVATSGLGAQRSASPSHIHTIWTAPVDLAGFSGPDFGALDGCRFEEGVTLTGDQLRSAVITDIETGPKCRLVGLNIGGDFDISNARGVRSLSLQNGSIAKRLLIGGAWPISLEVSGGNPTNIGELAAARKPFTKLELRSVSFRGDVDLQDCVIDELSFRSVVFSGMAVLSRARVSSGSICRIEDCRFDRAALFDRCSFGDVTSFDRTQFLGPTQFTSSTFAKNASFLGAAFVGSSVFGSSTEPSTVFEKDVDLSGSDLGELGGQFQEVQFRRVDFRGEVKIRNRRFANDTWFDNAAFARPPSFHGSEFHSMTSFNDVKFSWKQNRPTSTLDRAIFARWALWRRKPPPDRVAADNILLAKTADCFRVLTSMARRIDSPEMAHQFHIEELRARHHRAPGGGVGRPEAIGGRIYGWLASYGDSFVKPLVGLFATFAIFAFFYGAMVPNNVDTRDAAVSTSLTMQFRPLAAMDTNFGRLATPEQIVECDRQLSAQGVLSARCLAYHLAEEHDLQTKIVSSVQAALSLVFLFLFALGLRRKYQVS